MRQQQESKHHQSMSTSTTTNQSLLREHPSHHHPLKLLDLSKGRRLLSCLLCRRKISAEACTCQEGCGSDVYYHRACVEAPPLIDRHPLHPDHPLTLIHCHPSPSFNCDACDEHFLSISSSFRCDECEFNLDIGCALSTLSDKGCYQGGKTSEQITLPLHPHTLTSFSTRHIFVGGSGCHICGVRVEGDGYMCLHLYCGFVIHKTCIQDLYYADGTKAPRVYHRHPLEVFVGEEMGSRTCASCGSNKSGEFIGCASCHTFYHRHCFQVPEILRYPAHNPDHSLVLFLNSWTQQLCISCSISLKNAIHYYCTSCDFLVHVRCAFEVVTYCDEGMSAIMELSWHGRPLLLCHRTESSWSYCSYCGDKSIGPTYVCKYKDCRFLLHKRCTEIESTLAHPHHPHHPLTLCLREHFHLDYCKACGGGIDGFYFSCKRCLFHLHVKCAASFPTHKHYLHEHKLLRLEDYLYYECNRCDRNTNSPLFRCAQCEFNLHEECMELPPVVESEIHRHPLTLHETFLEDDSGEYYCDHCENERDGRLGAYVCGECKLSRPLIYHIECVLPEIGKVYKKQSSFRTVDEKLSNQIADQREEVVEKLCNQIADQKEEVRTLKEKVKEAKRVLHELVEQRNKLLCYKWNDKWCKWNDKCVVDF